MKMSRFLSFLSCLFVFTCIYPIESINNQPKPITINEDNWTEMLEGEWMVEL